MNRYHHAGLISCTFSKEICSDPNYLVSCFVSPIPIPFKLVHTYVDSQWGFPSPRETIYFRPLGQNSSPSFLTSPKVSLVTLF